MYLRQFFEHDGDYAMYLREERKVITEERARVKRLAAINSIDYWSNAFNLFLFFLTPKFIWSHFVEIKNNVL